MCSPTRNLGPIGSTVLIFMGYKPTNRQAKYIQDYPTRMWLETVNWILSELGTLEWDTINPDCLIRRINVFTLDFLLNTLFFGYSKEKSKTGFFKIESPSRFCILIILILYGAQNFKFIGFLYVTDWLNFIHFLGYKYKIKLVSRLRKIIKH